jgi:hypothetical protein
MHFILITKGEAMPFLYFAAVASAKPILRPDRIILHLHGEPRGVWWERVGWLIDEIRQ